MKLSRFFALATIVATYGSFAVSAPENRACPTGAGSNPDYFLVEVSGASSNTNCTNSAFNNQLRDFGTYGGNQDPATDQHDHIFVLDMPPLGSAPLVVTTDTDGCALDDLGSSNTSGIMPNTTYHGHTMALVNHQRTIAARIPRSAYLQDNGNNNLSGWKKVGIQYNRPYFLTSGTGAALKACKQVDANNVNRWYCRMCADPKDKNI